MTGKPAAVNILVSRSWSGALPDTNSFIWPPKAACHFEKISFRAMDNFKSYTNPTEET